jgi:hypothetical protein
MGGGFWRYACDRFAAGWEGAVEAIPAPMGGPADRGPDEAGPTRWRGAGVGRADVDAGEEVAAGAVAAGGRGPFFFSAACRIWSLRPCQRRVLGVMPAFS